MLKVTSFMLMKKLNRQYVHLFVLMTIIAASLGFPLKAKAEWYVIGYDEKENAIYMNDESVYIKGNYRVAEIRDRYLGRALFAVNCQTSDYYLQTNQGKKQGYAAPGTVAGVIADEICEKYNPR